MQVSSNSESSRPIRVVIVEDHPLFRRGIRELLTDQGIDVIGEAGNGELALSIIPRLRPDVTLMDLSMPGIDGVETTRRLRAAMPDAQVLVMTASSEEADVLDAIMAGAVGYLLKESPVDEILSAIRSAAQGHSAVTPEVATVLMRRLREHEGRPNDEGLLDALSERERQVLRLLASGRDNQSIASELLVGLGTVKSHVASVLEKLGVDNRVQAAVIAVRAGLL
jgi:DNA-binding NarL/FixJ family response regulator